MNEIPNNVFSRLEHALGLPDNWCHTLIAEEPWPFVIKLHAVIEASVSHLLNTELAHPGLRSFVEPMGMGGQFGKLALMRKMELLPEKSISFISRLGGMRNDCVHGVKNIAFRFETYIENMNEESRQNLVSLVRAVWLANTSDPDQAAKELDPVVDRDFKVGMFMAGMAVLADIGRKNDAARILANANRRILADAAARGPKFRLIDAIQPSGAFSDASFGEVGYSE